VITKLLVANRGEIACRVIRSARAMGIATVAVYSDADRHALHVEMADEAIALGGRTAAESYLRIDALIDAATRTEADAVHPGYGFLSERADFAQACAEEGLVFVGPTPQVIAAMGDKLTAKGRMREAGVPVLEAYEPDAVPDEVFPVMVKAAMGGGGKGMRVVSRPQDLPEAVAAARRESGAAFGDETVFVERYWPRPRHVEVQILGDVEGAVVHLGERECSIQRRHQKVIEESPSAAVDADLRKQIGGAAVAAATAIGYTNAGTVEFILSPDGSFAFLEVNTRLQVEHPVTELAWTVAGEPIDLVRLQLLVASGVPLGFSQDDVRLSAHAIEARLYAEDPGAGFLPSAGRLAVFEPSPRAGTESSGSGGLRERVRIDTGVRSGDEISVHYDPLLAKVIAAGATRVEAAAALARALDACRLHGISTNRDLLVAVLRHDAYLRGDLHTGFIDEHLPPAARSPEPDPHAVNVHALAAALCGARVRAQQATVLATIPTGWRNNRSQPQRVTFSLPGGQAVEVGYVRRRDATWSVWVGEVEYRVAVLAWPDERLDDAIDLEIDGRRLRVTATHADSTWYVDSPLGHATLTEVPRFPSVGAAEVAGGLVAPMPGSVVSVHAEPGQHVARGDLLVLVEAMKMEHPITAPHEGTVSEVRVAAGDAVSTGDILVVLGHEEG
jgi:propionyl-CoA carboxylase alpha chain